MESGKSADESWQNLKLCVKNYIEHCYTSYPDGLSSSASLKEWAAYAKELSELQGPPRVEQIMLELKPPLPEHEFPIWMEGVSENTSSCSAVQ